MSCWSSSRDGGSGTPCGARLVEFGDAPDEELGLLGPAEVTGALRDRRTLPARPARRLMMLGPLATDMGSDKPG